MKITDVRNIPCARGGEKFASPEDTAGFDSALPPVDPMLGAPFPPVGFYALPTERDGLGTHIYWLIPDLLISIYQTFSPVRVPPILTPWADILITSYHQGATTAEQSGNTVTLSGGAFQFIDTATHVGQKIMWESGDSTEIVTVESTVSATVNNSQSIAAHAFNVIPAATVLRLRVWDPLTLTYKIVGDNVGGVYPVAVDFGIVGNSVTGPLCVGWRHFPTLIPPLGNELIQVPAYVTATAGGTTLQSNAIPNFYINQGTY